MSTNKTSNYQLNQWVKSDRVLMEEFNADNAKIDAALASKASASAVSSLQSAVNGMASSSAVDSLTATVNGLKTSKADKSALDALSTTVNGKASQSALDALAATVSGKASQSALNALSATVSQHTTALAGKGNCNISTTTYIGAGESTKSLTFSKPPQLVIVGGNNGVLILPRGAEIVPALCGGFYLNDVVWNGNTVTWHHNGSGGNSGAMNGKSSTYYVIAFFKAD